jgi:2'-5' RNA ligase
MPVSADTWRCFVAVPVAAEVRAALAGAVDAWRADPATPDLRWTDPDGWHLTLAFLGSQPSSVVPLLTRALGAAHHVAPFAVSVSGLGAFPRPGAAQSVWFRIADTDRRLTALASLVSAAVLPDDPPAAFRPHLTVGRSRVRRGEPLGPWLASVVVPTASITVEEVVLYRSHLGSGPARYEALATVRLRGAGSGA